MKKLISVLLAAVLVLTLSVNAFAYDSSCKTGLDDFESFASSDDLIFNWYVQPTNEACGEMILDTSSKLHGKNSLLFDYSMAGAQSTGKGWCTFNFVPDDTRVTFGDGIKFAAACDSHVVARIVIIDLNYTYKQYFFDVTGTPKDYVIRWEDFERIPGQKTFDAKTATDIVSMDIALISDYQGSDFNKEGKFWFDDFCTFSGSDKTTKEGKALAKQPDAPKKTAAPTVTTKAASTVPTKAAEVSQDEPVVTTVPGETEQTAAPAAEDTQTTQTASSPLLYVVIALAVALAALIVVVILLALKNKKKEN